MPSGTNGKAWIVGVVVTLVTFGILWRDKALREASVSVLLGGLVLSAMAASLFRNSGKPGRVGPSPKSRMADGIVDIVPMSGVESAANAHSPRFGRFLQRSGGPGEAPKVNRLPTVRQVLLGEVTLISVFIGRDGKSWTDEEIARGLSAVEKAGLWIEREAIRHGAPVNLGLADTYFQVQDHEVDEVEVAFFAEGDDVGPMEANASTKAVVAASRAAASLGFADVVDLIGRINPRVESDSRVWILHLRQAGRSLAIPAQECEIDGVGLAICFSREASFPEPLKGPARVDPTTVAHELLHLFGASDKYGVSFRSFPTGTVSSRDIMRLNHDHLSRMTIDVLTASEVGWEPVFASKSSRKTPAADPGMG